MSMKSFFKPLIKKTEVIVISDDEEEQDSRHTNVTGSVLNTHGRTSSTASDWSDNSNATPPLREAQTEPETRWALSSSQEPETRCTLSSGVDKLDSEKQCPSSSGVDELDSEKQCPSSSGVDELHPEGEQPSSSGIDKLDSETQCPSSSGVDGLHPEGEQPSSLGTDKLDSEKQCPSSSGVDRLHPEGEQPSSLGTDKLDSEKQCPSSSGVDRLHPETEQPSSSGIDKLKCESRHPLSLEIDELLITPVPVNEEETFNRTDYQVPPQLVAKSEASNKRLVDFLSTCMPHIIAIDRPLILRKVKELLNQTNFHYLLSAPFHRTMDSIVTAVQKNRTSATVYLCIKELADELRSHRERKILKIDEYTSGVLKRKSGPLKPKRFNSSRSSSASAAATGSSDGDNSDPVIEAARVLAYQSLTTPSFTVVAVKSTSVAKTEPSSATAGKKDCVCESQKLAGADHEEKWSNGVGSMGETSGVSQKSDKQLRTKKYIQKLEKHLIQLHKAIKKISEEEVDMTCDDTNSAYIQEDRLKKKAIAVWRKLCELEPRHAITGRERKKFHYKGSPYRQINTSVEKLVNKRRIFPDFRDILDVVQTENEAHSLGLNSRQEKQLAEKVFQEVGKMLQKRRQKDELADALAYLEDGPGAAFTKDPAESDEELRKKLENNAKLSRHKMDEVMEVYVAKQEDMKQEAKEKEKGNCDLSPTPSDGSGSEDEDEDDNDDDLRAPLESLLENDTSLSESPVEQEKTKLDPQQGNQDICYLSSASNNSSEGENSGNEDSEDEREEFKDEDMRSTEKDLGNDSSSSGNEDSEDEREEFKDQYMRSSEKDLGNDRSSSGDEDSEDEREDFKDEYMRSTEKDILGNDRSSSEADTEEEEPDAEATSQVDSRVSVEDKDSSPRSLADGDSHSIVKGGPPVEERADCQDGWLATGLGQKSLLPGTETSSGAKGSRKEVPQLPTKKQECSLKKRSAPEPEVITILSDDEDVYEPSHPPAKVPKLCQRTNL